MKKSSVILTCLLMGVLFVVGSVSAEPVELDFESVATGTLPPGWNLTRPSEDIDSWYVARDSEDHSTTSNKVLCRSSIDGQGILFYTHHELEDFVFSARIRFFDDPWGKYSGLVFGVDLDDEDAFFYRIWLMAYVQPMLELNDPYRANDERVYLGQGRTQLIPVRNLWYWIKLEVVDGTITFYTSMRGDKFDEQFSIEADQNVSTRGFLGLVGVRHVHWDDVTIVPLD